MRSRISLSIVRQMAHVAAATFSTLLALAAGAHAQAPAASSVRGQITERIVSVNDSTQLYAELRPAGYTASKRWPVLFVLDPGGRALPALQRFAGAADRLGFIVISSYDSRSDSTLEVNSVAMDAMLTSAQTRLSIDTQRIYLAGFSGTARAIWDFALDLHGHVAGVIGFGAGIQFRPDGPERVFNRDSSFAFFGGAGDEDFNYFESRGLAVRLQSAAVPARVAEYPGPHAWPPVAVCTAALEWMQARAMLGGRAPLDSAFLTAYIAAATDTARALERAHQPARAATEYRRIADDFQTWPGAADAARRAADLENTSEVKAFRSRYASLEKADQRQGQEMDRTFSIARAGRRIESVDQLLDQLKALELQRQAANTDSVAGPAARRLLARMHAFLSSYEPRAYLARGAAREAIMMLGAAARLAPLSTQSCSLLTRAHARAADVLPELVCPKSG